MINESYSYVANKLFIIGTHLDNFFADNDTLESKKNDTRIILSSETKLSEYDKMQTYGKFRFELSLPKTEKRFQLVFERDRVDKDEDEDNNSTSQRLNREQETSAALQFILEESQLWGLTTNVGAKFGLPPLLFSKTQLRRSFYISDTHIYPTFKFLWEDQKGWQISSEFHADTSLNSTFTFRWLDQWVWNDTDFVITQAHGPSLYQKIDDRRALSYNARAAGNNSPHEAINYYNLNLRYREKIYSYWLFMEVSPQLEFFREDNFRRDLNLIVSLEVVIFKQ